LVDNLDVISVVSWAVKKDALKVAWMVVKWDLKEENELAASMVDVLVV